MICAFILEDMTMGVQRQLDWQTKSGVGPIAEAMFMGQKYDMGVICVTHTLSGTSPIIRDNVETFIMTGLPGENPRLICDTLGVTPEMAEKIKTLRPGEFAILNPVLWDKCVYATFEKPQIPGSLRESERRQVVESFLKKVKSSVPAPLDVFTSVPLAKTAPENNHLPAEETLSSSHIEMLVYIVTGGPKPLCRIYEQMGLSRAQGRRIVKRLDSIGVILLHTVPTGKRGGRLSFPQITNYGWEILKNKGISQPKSKTKGGFIHELAASLIEAWERKRSRTFEFEVDIGGKRVDSVSIDKTSGLKTLWNIGVSDSVREADNIEAILKLPVMQTSKFIFVARDTKFASEVTKLLRDKDPSGKLLSRVEIKTIAVFVDV